jgi:SPP1 family predicted phage head-tail adaptor
MRAGQLRHRVTLQSQQLADDLAGGDDVSFRNVATLWANVSTSGGREFFEAKKLVPELTHQVEIRYRADVTPGMRFVLRNSVLRIHAAPDPDERRTRLLCMCTELVQ